MKNSEPKDKVIAHAERSHAPFGGSVAARRLNCTASYAAEAQMPEPDASDAADEGTKAHEVCDYVLSRFLYHKVHGEYPELEQPEQYNDFIDVAEEYTKAVWENALQQTITGKQYGIEQRVTINENLGMYGPSDFVCVAVDERGRYYGIVGDFKFGYTYVDEKKSDQLAHYACGLRESVRGLGKELEYVKAFIYQPRVGNEAYRETVFTGKFLDTWMKKALKAAETIFITKKVKFKAGSWCGFCKAKPVCETYLQEKQRNTRLDLVNYKTASLPDVNLLSPEHVVKLVLHGDELIDLVKAATALANNMCNKQGEWAGLKLVETSGRRSWIKDADTVINTLESMGVDPYSKKLINITDAQRLLTQATGQKDAAQEIMKGLTVKSAPTALVEVSDPRPAIASSKDMLTKLE